MLASILLSVKFMIVLLLQKKDKLRDSYDYNVVEIPLENFSVMAFKSSGCKSDQITYDFSLSFVPPFSS